MNFRKNKKMDAGILLSAVFFLVMACGEKTSDEKAAEKATEAMLKATTGKDVDINAKNDDVEIKDTDSTTEMKNTNEWPSDMPSVVPRFTEGKIEHVVISHESGGEMKFNIHMKGIEGEAVKKYSDQLKSSGWEVNFTEIAGQGGILNGQKGNLTLSLPYNLEEHEGVLMVFGKP